MVNLYSDTQTRPTPEMRDAIARAQVGDEQRRADPTVLALEERVAALLGHEAALFVPSGTMCNEIAIRVHIRPGGDEILLGRETHPLRFEGGAPAAVSGAVMTIVEGDAGRFAAEAWRWKQMLGGAMRQSGIIAAAGLYALDHHVDRLADDHERARRLAEGLAALPGVEIDVAAVETNILVFAVPDAPAFCESLDRDGVKMIPLDARRVRAVTHLDVDDAGIDRALEAAGDAVRAMHGASAA